MTAQLAGGAGFTEDDERQMAEAIGKWLERDVRPHVLQLDHADVYPHEMVEQMAELGLMRATIAPEYGGLGCRPRSTPGPSP